MILPKGEKMEKEKYWINCSPQEKKAVKDIERKKGWLDFLYLRRLISKEVWMCQKKKLIDKLDEVKKTYE